MKAFIRYIVIATVLAVLMGAEWWMNSPAISRLTDNLPSKIRAVFNDSELQPWIMGSFLIYIATFIAIQLKQSRDATDRYRLYCLAAVQGLAAISYFREPGSFGPQTTDALVFSGCCALGLAFVLCNSISRMPAEKWLKEISVILVLLLAASSLCSGEDSVDYRYREAERATGIWRNPNTHGLLMGCGLVLALGLLAEWGWNYIQSKATCTPITWKDKLELLLVLPAVLLLTGLIQSLSRGAWLGTTLALIWLASHFLQILRGTRGTETSQALEKNSRLSFAWIQANLKPTALLFIAMCLLTFWTLRHVEHPHLRRVFTVGNASDLSWRNRVISYEQALLIMDHHPLSGFGWSRWKHIHETFYQPPSCEESAAISLNDYFLLGIGGGLPCLLSLLGYLGLAMASRQVSLKNPTLLSISGNFTIASAGVLLVGFWIDGGLFKLAVGASFWILIHPKNN